MSSDIAFYRSLLVRRMPLMVTIFVLCSAIGFGLAMTLPPKYSASAQLLLESAQIPDQTQSATTAPGSEQLQIIERRVMTRANLIDIANKYSVFASAGRMSPDAVVEEMRELIEITSRSGSNAATTMNVEFTAENPRLAANVVNEVVTLVLQLDTQRRVGIAEQTLDFFDEEVKRLDQELAIRSSAIVSFKEQNQDALPENLEYRVDRQARLQDQIIVATRDRAALTEQRNRLMALGTDSLSNNAPRLSPSQQALLNAQTELQQALTIYSEQNPRIRVLRARVAQLEAQVSGETGQEAEPVVVESQAKKLFDLQLEEIDQRFEFLDKQIERAETEIATLTTAIEKTPENAIRLESLQRDYENTLEQYNAAVANRSAASSRERIETLAKGERITVIEQASAPTEPTSPNRRLVAGGGVVLGTALAAGVFVLLELLNRAVRRPIDLVRGLQIQPIATIPYLETSTGKKRRRFTQIVLIGALAIGIPIILWAVHMFYLPLDLIIDKILSRFGF